VSPSPDPDALAQAVRAAVDAAEGDLARMPFFVRPMARRGFVSRTGLTHDAWRQRLGEVRASDTPASVRARWQGLAGDLARLVEDFRTAPERAAKGMDDPVVLGQVRERASQRVAVVQALVAWVGA
jgi:hypothetical protein